MSATAPLSDTRRAYYGQIAQQRLAPLWESLHNLVPKTPQPKALPAIWKYAQIRDLVMQAGAVISAEEAVRRVLVLENPGLPGKSALTPNLYAGLQLILPGEIAPSHRHTQSALRFIVEGKGAWTAVNGERTTMHPGDFIITPSWTWHDHGNPSADEGGEPVVWLDGLDIPLVAHLDAGFAQSYPEATQPVSRPEGDSFARFGHNMVPVRHRVTDPTSPIFSYPYARSREALDVLYRGGELDPWDGVKLRYVNPATGGWPMPTIATFMQFLPTGFRGRTYRSTDSTVYCVVEGKGTAHVGGESFAFDARDVFVAPSWQPVRLDADSDAVLFSYSDRPVLAALNLLREERV
ncbi:gentisate 1,2-dioxygenase [Paraburkholderia caballeronis]|uniref:Gentisate 1,2-dioxygenase n=1 Tax=Paraburkholderia caballeronis TaxID=416943 RepID=A0A1H7HKB8_9BURK|nr:gentisate 1,2-dioxygenase [Paraburkholderia caballeronis]PXW29465.1 gentisate 1,2-dioxygenase [Paraburkholderia caballeronis]PXX04724.1 gentisate 1,2-dioxygenase [Paraburkholderia caballeronis]RAK05785.1 gentisate 1,2-dioxygenase [Paraburkholderia caballeronis]SED03516.1 gentisate 1,2-dioxygenase [Paraburkholderia caballeronis]SEK50843.1 gentisate 1,2-dioxygenase [Paraburkholderia caballeronis]